VNTRKDAPRRGSLSLDRVEERDLRGLPRGRTRLPKADVEQAQRDRILRAIIAAAADHGYPSVTVTEVVKRARVSRSSFYAQFPDKEDCFFTATAQGRHLMFGRLTTAVRELPAQVPEELRLRAGLRAYLEFLRDEPTFAAVFYLELPGVGRRGAERLADARRRFAAMNAAWHARARHSRPEWPAVRPEAFHALTGATEELVRDKVWLGHTDELPELEDVLVALHLRLLTGDAW
jgi:AcrR family transcriptional regulator